MSVHDPHETDYEDLPPGSQTQAGVGLGLEHEGSGSGSGGSSSFVGLKQARDSRKNKAKTKYGAGGGGVKMREKCRKGFAMAEDQNTSSDDAERPVKRARKEAVMSSSRAEFPSSAAAQKEVGQARAQHAPMRFASASPRKAGRAQRPSQDRRKESSSNALMGHTEIAVASKPSAPSPGKDAASSPKRPTRWLTSQRLATSSAPEAVLADKSNLPTGQSVTLRRAILPGLSSPHQPRQRPFTTVYHDVPAIHHHSKTTAAQTTNKSDGKESSRVVNPARNAPPVPDLSFILAPAMADQSSIVIETYESPLARSFTPVPDLAGFKSPGSPVAAAPDDADSSWGSILEASHSLQLQKFGAPKTASSDRLERDEEENDSPADCDTPSKSIDLSSLHDHLPEVGLDTKARKRQSATSRSTARTSSRKSSSALFVELPAVESLNERQLYTISDHDESDELELKADYEHMIGQGVKAGSKIAYRDTCASSPSSGNKRNTRMILLRDDEMDVVGSEEEDELALRPTRG